MTTSELEFPLPMEAQTFPQASCDRWKPIRSGLINLYRYDHQVFEYEQGRLLLRGNNGTGKSRVLALQLPFLLDGEIAPARVEPDADPAKRMEWNLLMGGRYSDRLGYTWIEFGRVDQGVPRYLTLGCGLSAVEGRPGVQKWFFVTSLRVGEQLNLQLASGQILTRERLVEALRGHGQIYTSAKEYRAAVDESLFGLGSRRYDALVSLLIQLRHPQLTRHLDESRLSAALSEALPPVSETMLETVAEAFRGLEKDRLDLAALQSARKGAEEFLQEYRRYIQIALRRRASDLRGKHSTYETHQRKLRAATVQRQEAQEEHDQASRALEAGEVSIRAAQQRVETLRSSPEMRAAEQLSAVSGRVQERRQDAERADGDVEEAQASLQAREQQVGQDERDAQEAWNAVRTLTVQARSLAEPVVLDQDHADAVQLLDLPDATDPSTIGTAEQLLGEVTHQRSQHSRQLKKLNEGVTKADGEWQLARRVQESASGQLTRAQDEHKSLHDQNIRGIEGLIQSYERWHQALQALASASPADVAEEVMAWSETGDGTCPTVRAAEQAAATLGSALATRRAEAEQGLAQREAERTDLQAEHDQLAAGRHQPPLPPPARGTGVRENRPGAPIWALCGFSPALAAGEQAGLEAALESSGLLDAWLTPDGQLLDEHEHDVFLIADGNEAHSPEHSLADQLVYAPEASAGGAVAVSERLLRTVLGRIGWGVGQGNVWVTGDGRWRLGPLRGAWSKASAEHIGQAAREAARRQRLAEIDREIGRLGEAIAADRRELDEIERQGQLSRQERESVPTGEPVRQALAALTAKTAQIDGLRQQSIEADRTVAQRRQQRDTLTGQRDLAAREMRLERWIHDLDGFDQALQHYQGALARLWPSIRDQVRARAKVSQAQKLKLEAAEKLAELRGRLQQAQERYAAAEAELSALQAVQGVTAQQVLKQFGDAKEELGRLQAQQKCLTERCNKLDIAIAVAQQTIGTCQEAQDAAAAERDKSSAVLASFVMLGLPRVAAIDVSLPEPASWSASAAVDAARRLEAALADVPESDVTWGRSQEAVTRQHQDLTNALLPHGHRPELHVEHEVYVVTVVFQGVNRTMAEFHDDLTAEISQRQTILDARERELLESHLIREVAAHLHELLHEAEELVHNMNEQLSKRPTSTGMTLKFTWSALEDGPPGLRQARERLMGQVDTWSEEDRRGVGQFLQQRIGQVRQEHDTGTWLEHLQLALDYRQWHRFDVWRQQEGRWVRLTRRTHGTGSGGEKAIALTLPQFAAASAHYDSAHKTAPRLILLDEAFVGIDLDMRAKCMGLLDAFDLDFVMTSEREWGCYASLPGLAIYHLVTQPGNDAVFASHWVWNGRERVLVPEGKPPRPAAVALGEQVNPGPEAPAL